jgi:hypothetical protein
MPNRSKVWLGAPPETEVLLKIKSPAIGRGHELRVLNTWNQFTFRRQR